MFLHLVNILQLDGRIAVNGGLFLLYGQQADADFSGIIIRKGEPELLEAINKALVDIKADGTYDKISQKYFGADVSK